jgi:large-conductance mechanosensitive channel
VTKHERTELIKSIIYPMLGALILFGGAGVGADIWEHNCMTGMDWLGVLTLIVMFGIIGFYAFLNDLNDATENKER